HFGRGPECRTIESQSCATPAVRHNMKPDAKASGFLYPASQEKCCALWLWASDLIYSGLTGGS
ncbi:hypothetical protein, partial [Photobacterium galatheae]|uniref:hypothetical protein n=1 Tax=Photobacterium galatheae TaxID=1654360 RepID=UPI001F1E8C41